jgi:hypothetical protein
MDTAAKIEAVKSVSEPGMSASQIASYFDGATRNAIIGLFHRHALVFEGKARLRTRTDTAARIAVAKRGRIKSRKSAPLPSVELHKTETHLCGRPLFDLKAKECRWSVNEAEPSELHLFCGMPTETTYCQHHTSRAHREQA